MEIDKFLSVLAESKDEYFWQVNYSGAIRCIPTVEGQATKCCPITAVCWRSLAQFVPLRDVADAGAALELSTDLARDIADAADIPSGYFATHTRGVRLQAIRQRLLEVLELKEIQGSIRKFKEPI